MTKNKKDIKDLIAPAGIDATSTNHLEIVSTTTKYARAMVVSALPRMCTFPSFLRGMYNFGDINGNIFSLIICFVPRILTGLFTSLSFDFFGKIFKEKKHFLKIILSSVIGSLTNTFGVLGFIFLFFGTQYEKIIGQPILIILSTIILTNGIPEAIISAIISVLIFKILKNRIE